jgi:hypothetical protein
MEIGEESKQGAQAETRPTATFSDMRAALQARFTPAAQHAATATAKPEDALCHCLVMDVSKLAADSPLRASLVEATRLAHGDQEPALIAHLLTMLPGTDAADVSLAYVVRGVVHISFACLPALGRALARFPFLVRCGTLQSGPWHGNSEPCGPKRHLLPEALRFSCLPACVLPKEQLQGAVQQMLDDAQLAHNGFWFPSTYSRPTPARGGRDQSPRITFYVLARHIDSIAQDIARLHRTAELWGGKLLVSAPNIPSLVRCPQCDQLGHRDTACPQYGGVGLRLLFKQSVPYPVLKTLLERTGAKGGYLGSGVDERAPSHKVTLLFDVASDQDADGLQRMLQLIAPTVNFYLPLLHSAPDLVRPKDRHNECRDCGSLTRAHECPFALGHAAKRSRVAPPASRAAAERAPAASAAPRAAPRDHMCKSWRQKKSCRRLDAGLPCDFDHPADYVVQPKLCHQFTRTGFCHQGTTCKFEHSAAARSTELAADASVEVAVAAPAAAAAAAAAAPAAAAPAAGAAPAAAAAARTDAAPPAPAVASPPRARNTKRKAADSAERSDDVDRAAPSAVTPKASPKKSKAAALSASTNSFAALSVDGDDDDSMAERQPLRNSSLGTLPSPAKPPASLKKKDRPKPTRSSSADEQQL